MKSTKEFKYHTENLRAVERAYRETLKTIRASIRNGDEALEESQTKLCALLLGIWAEARLSKLLNEQEFFSPADRVVIFGKDNLFERWLLVVAHGFKKHHGVKTLSARTLKHGSFHQYQTLRENLETHLKVVLELRNKLAHGQWIYPFPSKDPNGPVVAEKFQSLKNLNVCSLELQYLILRYLSEMVFLLEANKVAFQRDFDQLYSNIMNQVDRLRLCDYPRYKSTLRKRVKNMRP